MTRISKLNLDKVIKEFLCSKCKKPMEKIENGYWCSDCCLIVIPQEASVATVTFPPIMRIVTQITPYPKKWREKRRIWLETTKEGIQQFEEATFEVIDEGSEES